MAGRIPSERYLVAAEVDPSDSTETISLLSSDRPTPPGRNLKEEFISLDFQQLSLDNFRLSRVQTVAQRQVRSADNSPDRRSPEIQPRISPLGLRALDDIHMNAYERRGLLSPGSGLVSPRLRSSAMSVEMLARNNHGIGVEMNSIGSGGVSNGNGSGAEDSDHVNVMVIQRASSPAVQPWMVSIARAIILVLLWYISSMCLSMYNKFVIGSKHGHFPAPLLMTTFHFLLQYLISIFCLRCVCTSWGQSVKLTWKDYFLRVAPTAIATAVDVGLSNVSLAFITLTFYTMCKASAPVFLLIFAFAFRLESPSVKLVGIIMVISLGVLLTVAGETQFQLGGFILVMLAATTSGLRWVLIQVLLHRDKLGLTNPLVTLSYLTPIMALVCGVFSLLNEPWHTIHKTAYFDSWEHALGSTLVMIVGGILAFIMIMVEFLLILETSAVTFSVAGTVKEAATILVSHLVFRDKFTHINMLGLFIIMFGVSLFNVYKYGRMKEGKAVTHEGVEEEEPMLQGDMGMIDPPVVVSSNQALDRHPLMKVPSSPKTAELTQRLGASSLPSPGSQHLHERKVEKSWLDRVEEGQEMQ